MNDLLHTPEGVRDVYGSDYKNKHNLTDKMWDVIAGYGYQLIDTPTFEYLDCYSKDVGSTPISDLYKFTDREGNILALRPDFTPSIARVSARYFMDNNTPIKLAYNGNVYKNHDSLKGRLNESTQLGIEFIGDKSIEADAETVAMAIDCLLCSTNKLKVSIGHIDIIYGLFKAAEFNSDEKEVAYFYVKNKNFSAINDLLTRKNPSKEIKEAFEACMNPVFSPSNIDELLKKVDGIKETKEAILYLKEILELLEIYGASEYVSLDLTLTSDYKYYTGIIFHAYTYGSGNAVLSGGRYDKLLSLFGKDTYAIGFAIYIDDLFNAVKREGKVDEPIEIREVILYEDKHRIEAIKNATLMRNRGKKVLALTYQTKEELEILKKTYANDNLYLITDGNYDEW